MVFSVTPESVNSVSNTGGPIYAKMELKDRHIKFQVDCGATVNVISQKYVHNESLEKSNTKLTMYNKTTLKPIGKCRIIMRNPTNGKKYNVLFEVVKEDLGCLPFPNISRYFQVENKWKTHFWSTQRENYRNKRSA